MCGQVRDMEDMFMGPDCKKCGGTLLVSIKGTTVYVDCVKCGYSRRGTITYDYVYKEGKSNDHSGTS